MFFHIRDEKEFFAYLSCMTFKHYSQQPKQEIEWSFIKKMSSNQKFLDVDMDIYNPIMNEFRKRIFSLPGEDDDQ